jgi:hypothetical protein
MAVIGSSLEQQSEAMRSVGKSDAAQSLADCWRIVEVLAGKRKEKGPSPKVSNRIKFMLQDLLEMRSKGKTLCLAVVMTCRLLLLMHLLDYVRLGHTTERGDRENHRRDSQGGGERGACRLQTQ